MEPINSKPRRTAFTLIELLVVVAVIAILMGLILPVIGGAKNKALAANCVSNLRQLGMALNMYCDDHSDVVPMYQVVSGDDVPTWSEISLPANQAVWFNVITPYIASQPSVASYAGNPSGWYVKGINILQCPAVTWSGSESSGTGPQFSYAMNQKVVRPTHSAPTRQSLINAALDPGGTNVNHRPVDLSTIPFIIDTHASVAEPLAWPGESNVASKVGSPNDYTARISNRHNGRCQMVFFDGHVASYYLPEIMNLATGKNITTSPVIWQPWNPDAP